jgi:membrane protease YdiL (CAAX protease family)
VLINPFLNSERHLRNGWWMLIFFFVLAAILFPILLVARQYSMDVSIGVQAFIVMLATWVCQVVRRKPLAEILGEFNLRWFKEIGLGGLIGSALMLIPALFLWVFGWVHWQVNPVGFSTVSSTIWLFAGVALAEELLFRGFIFQRLIAGIGQLPAQLLMAFYFLLTHLNNPGMNGNVKTLAGINIFAASLVFGLAFIRTKSLAMPLGLHFMANLTQGGVLGFGVSGTEQTGLLMPVFSNAPVWLTGGSFGLEASLPGLVCIILTFVFIQKWDISKTISFL